MKWIELSKTLGVIGIITSVVVPAVVWLVKKITEQFLARDLEKFKTDLEKEAIRHKVKFEQLHIERAQVIKEIYYQFHDVKNSLRKFVGKISGSYKNFNEKPEHKEYFDYDQEAIALRKNIEKNAIFFCDDLVEKMLKTTGDLQYAPITAHNAHEEVNDEAGVKFKIEQYSEMVRLLSGQVLKPLEKEFKKILDIEISDNKE